MVIGLRSNKLSLLALLLILLLPFTLLAELVISSGVGNSVETAHTNAKKTALRNEIETRVGENSFSRNKERIESIFVENYRSYILSSKVLESRNEFGITKVRARVEFQDTRIQDILKEEGLVSASMSKPRIMLLLDERVKGEPAFEKSATFALEQVLTSAGFTVVEPEQMRQVQEQEKALQMNQDALATLAFRSGADLLLKGTVSVGQGQEQTVYGMTQYSVPLQMNVRVVRADNAEIVLSQMKSVRKNAQDEFSAGQFGLQQGGQTIGQLIARQLTDLWNSEMSAPKSIELMATGTDFDNLDGNISRLPQVITSHLRYLEDKSALYDLRIRGSVQDLRESLSELPGWNVTLMTKNRIGIGSSSAPQQEVEYDYVEPEISVSNFAINDIFPSRGRFYENNPLGSVTIDLKEGATIKNVKVSTIIPEIMDLASEVQLDQLSAGKSQTVDLTLLMNNDKLLANREERRVTGKVTVSFYQNNKQVTRELSVPVVLHDANAMDWADASSIASFVTYRNSTVDMFARQSVTSVDKTGFNDQFESALAIFTTLKEYGITYVKDPIPSGDARVLDKVQFPLETLEKNSGDCDDSSVLMASLLSAVGIDVAFISYPDHVLIMFDTGIFAKNRYKLGVDQNSVIVHNNKCWIPVETTLLKQDFLTAWRTATEEFHLAVADGQPIEITELKTAWDTFPPFNYSRTNSAIKAPQSTNAIRTAMETVTEQLKGDILQQIDALATKPDKSPSELNKLGVLYARSGDYTKAVSHFTGISIDNETFQNMNNLGCALMLSGDEVRGAEMIEKSIAINSTPAALVNRALAYYLMSNSPEGVQLFVSTMNQANAALPEGESLEQMLGIDLGGSNGDRAAGEHEAQKTQTVDKRRLQELLRQRVINNANLSHDAKKQGITADVNVMPFGGVRGADPTQVATIADLLFWME